MRKSIKGKNFKSCRFPLIRKSAEVLILEGLREGLGCLGVGEELAAGEGVLWGERLRGQGSDPISSAPKNRNTLAQNIHTVNMN